MDPAYTTSDPGQLYLTDSGLALPDDPTTDPAIASPLYAQPPTGGLAPPSTGYRIIDTLDGPLYVSELWAGEPGVSIPDTGYKVIDTPDGPIYVAETAGSDPFITSDPFSYGTTGALIPSDGYLAPSDGGVVERIGDTLADVIESIGRQLPGVITGQPPVRTTAAPGGLPALNWGTIALVGLGAWLLFRR